MYKLHSTKIDLVLSTELFLWINSISICLLQIWVCKHERFQRCVIILIVQVLLFNIDSNIIIDNLIPKVIEMELQFCSFKLLMQEFASEE